MLQGEGGVPMLLQTSSSSQQQILIQNSDTGALSNLVILDTDKVGTLHSGPVHCANTSIIILPFSIQEAAAATSLQSLVTSADTTGGVATLPAIPSSTLLSQVGSLKYP